ncbi:MAG: SatD family protein [Melioribacteraceae bacterium]|nr:SatD family protein [Melioribacteraceae bacterium]MCF8355477.1 SatD family protein [Melioribacteraceae bacterium]MCF8394902.1 SatD family protein [Melioribacteraceae bacterium]MCF8420456.1 SatD family protein [Melioribacteraceae bacterium]
MKKLALIADIVESRNIGDRKKLQTKLKRKLTSINRKSESILSPLTITLGDEFQGLYKNADVIFLNIFEILLAIYPVKVRFSLGVGEISTVINKENAIGMDGEAFYIAREKMNKLKEDNSLISIGGVEKSIERMINLNLELVY